MNKLKILFILILTIGMFADANALRPPFPEGTSAQGNNNTQPTSYRADCAESTSQTDLSINNVRVRLLGGGDMWWDFNDGKYIVPNVTPGSGLSEVASIFAGAIWLGGFEFDEFGNPANLKMAAQTYRSNTANDFWPGPLDLNGGTTEETCDNWDKHFRVTGEDILAHISAFNSSDFDCEAVPNSIKGWPGKGNTEFAGINGFSLPDLDLAPFFDNDGDGLYDPCQGDFPIIEMIGCPTTGEPSRVAFADEMIWWVFNDNGGIHTRTTADPIRMEVQTLAFAYQTGDEVNDMTFYRYKLTNRSAITIDSTYFGKWVDADLGCPTDDFIGCDVDRSLMFIYNDGAPDGAGGCGNIATYGNEVPTLGVDYFRGPKDEFGNELGMSSFIYYFRGDLAPNPNMGDPSTGPQFYNYLAGRWRDGTPYFASGNGYNQMGADVTSYMFDGNPADPAGYSMCTENINSADLRTVQASGPFQLQTGAINELILGIVWTPDIQYPCPDLGELNTADNLAQALYDNCFKITDGPDAPDVDIVELDKKLILLLSNDTARGVSNNRYLSYSEKDLQAPPGEPDSMYLFEGYKVYQLAQANFNDLDDPDQARLIFQSDLNNGVAEIYNWVEAPGNVADVPVFIPELKVTGADEGLQTSIVVTEDQFAQGDAALVNHKTYYFVAVAYAHNNYEQYNPTDRTGQRSAYLEGRRRVIPRVGIPRIPTPEFGGITLNADYGDGAPITRLDGVGTGNNFLNLSEATIADILNESTPAPTEITYAQGGGPITVKVVDPLRIQPGTYEVTIFDENLDDDVLEDTARWMLTTPAGEQWFSEVPINILNEQILMGKDRNGESNSLGISLAIGQVAEPGSFSELFKNNGFLGANSTYADEDGVIWYVPVAPSAEFGGGALNYLPTGPAEIYEARDPEEIYRNELGGTWVPYTLTLCNDDDNPSPLGFVSPAWDGYLIPGLPISFCDEVHTPTSDPGDRLKNLNNVDIVLTSDKSLWSRCIVVETARPTLTQNGTYTTQGGDIAHMDLRAAPSVGKDGLPDGTGNSMSWFPGYAIDVETGKRLNIFFGENSVYRPDEATLSLFVDQLDLTGGDMIWNPTEVISNDLDNSGGISSPVELIMGGHHFIYVSNTEYDQCEEFLSLLSEAQPAKINVFSTVTWTSLPVKSFDTDLLSVDEGIIPNDLTFQLRVQNPYGVDPATFADQNDDLNGYPRYTFNMDGSAPDVNNETTAETALDLINVVPNPYYAYSEYELQNTSNVVKITNLPPTCTITIYSLDGKFIRKYERAEDTNATVPKVGAITEQINASVDWDMRNSRDIPIASGVYLIHVSAPGLGERTLKWFGVQRTFDTYRN